jgi:hypothetical protein
MMNNQEIIDNAPECATHVDHLYLYWMVQDRDAFNWQGTGWQLISSDAEDFRSLADIKRIVELEDLLKKFRPCDEDGDGWDFVYDEGSEYLGEAVLEALKEQINE